jgi:tetratricopeptide (TPR) repeat protein
MRLPLVWAFVACLAALLQTHLVHAEGRGGGARERRSAPKQADATPSPAEPPEYRATIDRALEEYQLGNFQEARDQFARAHTLYPNARTLRGLGFTAFELRAYVEAVGQLEQALGSTVKPLEGQLRQETQDMLERARSYVGELSLQLTPPNAVVIVDGIRRAEADAVMRLDVGDHVIEVRAEGYLAERRAVRVQGGQQQRLDVTLSKVALSSAPPISQDRRSEQPVYKRWWLWTVVGVVVAGAVTGLAIGLSKKEQTEYRGVPSDRTPDGVAIETLWGR